MTVTLTHQPHSGLDFGYIPVFRVTAAVDRLAPASFLAETAIRYSVPHRSGERAQVLKVVLQLSSEESLEAVAV